MPSFLKYRTLVEPGRYRPMAMPNRFMALVNMATWPMSSGLRYRVKIGISKNGIALFRPLLNTYDAALPSRPLMGAPARPAPRPATDQDAQTVGPSSGQLRHEALHDRIVPVDTCPHAARTHICAKLVIAASHNVMRQARHRPVAARPRAQITVIVGRHRHAIHALRSQGGPDGVADHGLACDGPYALAGDAFGSATGGDHDENGHGYGYE